jgi:exodeoxyribonuclease VIII
MEMYNPQLKYGGNIFEPGEHDIDIKLYHESAGISRSGISEFKKSPLHYWQAYLSPNRIRKQDTKAMIFGDAVHTKIMEPDLFDDRFAVSKKFDGRKNAGKAAKIDFEIANQGKKILDTEDYLIIEAIENEVNKHPLINRLIEGGKIERSLFWADSETEILCKARPDIWTNRCLIDIKTTEDSSFNEFIWSIKNYNYHIQAAMQIDAIKEITGKLIHDFIFIVIQKTPPYKPYLYNLDDLCIEYGRQQYKKLLKVLRVCFDTNDWSKDRDQVIQIGASGLFVDNYIETLIEIHDCI